MLIDIHSHHIHTAEDIFVPRSFGVHPWHSNLFSASDLPSLRLALADTCRQKSVAMVGECGLDALQGASMDFQLPLFRIHAEVAEEVAKPVVVHCVRSFNELMSLRSRNGYHQPWVVHGYIGSPQMALQLWHMGIWCSFGAAMLNPTRTKPIEALRQLGPERLFLETDASPIDIHDVYAAAATHLSLSVDELSVTINKNFSRLFE